MKSVLVATFLIVACGTTQAADNGIRNKFRLADGATDACFSNCANESASCKRACPVTFNVPCLSSCDSQMQTCKASCQRK